MVEVRQVEEMSRMTVLLVDEDEAALALRRALIERGGHRVSTASSVASALCRASTGVDVIVSTVRRADGGGMALLDAMGSRQPEVPVVLLATSNSVALAVDAMKRGAADYLVEPCEASALIATIDEVLARTTRGPTERSSRRGLDRLVGDAPAMRETKELIARASRRDSTVLLRGETGTGKELAARALHDLGHRAEGPFVRVHCAALPDTLLESELFGHEAGAFTGAIRRKPGRVELATGGTLFLDEIGDVTPAVQVKLLHLLQEREFSRLGGTTTLRADVRFVAATHRDLEALVENGNFRADLFYRLQVVPIWLPPLRARPSDVPALIARFVDKLDPAVQFDDAAIARLAAAPWPGNVRQLENFVERLVVLRQSSDIGLDVVERELERTPRSDPPPGLAGQRKDAERRAVLDALRQSGGNRSQAARILGISRRTLYKKLEQQSIG
jgi:two-component system, NtrC family, response regulator AtoC